MRGRFTAALGAIAAAILIAAPGTFAASPGQIYKDYADNGRLDGHYSAADLQRALKDAVVQGYGGPKGQGLKPTIKKKIGQTKAKKKGVVSAPPVKKTGPLPFTGLDLALISFGGVSLLLLGAGLRRFARRSA